MNLLMSEDISTDRELRNGLGKVALSDVSNVTVRSLVNGRSPFPLSFCLSLANHHARLISRKTADEDRVGTLTRIVPHSKDNDGNKTPHFFTSISLITNQEKIGATLSPTHKTQPPLLHQATLFYNHYPIHHFIPANLRFSTTLRYVAANSGKNPRMPITLIFSSYVSSSKPLGGLSTMVLVAMSTRVTMEGTRGMRQSKLGAGGKDDWLDVNNEFLLSLLLLFLLVVVVG